MRVDIVTFAIIQKKKMCNCIELCNKIKPQAIECEQLCEKNIINVVEDENDENFDNFHECNNTPLDLVVGPFWN